MWILLSAFLLAPTLATFAVIWANGFSPKILELILPTVGVLLALLTATFGLSKTVLDSSQSNFKKIINFSVFEYKPFKIVPLTNVLKSGLLNQSSYDGLKDFEDGWRSTFVLPATPEDERDYKVNDPKFEEFFQANFLIWLSKQFSLGWKRNDEFTYLTTFGRIGSSGFGPDQKYMRHIFLRDLLPENENKYIKSLPPTEKLDLRIPGDADVTVSKNAIVIESSYGRIDIAFFKNGDAMSAYQPGSFNAASIEKIHRNFASLYPGKAIGDLLVRNFAINISCERKSWRRFSKGSEHIWSMCNNLASAANAEFSTIAALGKLEK